MEIYPLGDPCLSLYTLEGYGYKESILFGTIQYLAVHIDLCHARLDLVGWATPDGVAHILSYGYRGPYPHRYGARKKFGRNGCHHLHVLHLLFLRVRRITVVVMRVRVSPWLDMVFVVVGKMLAGVVGQNNWMPPDGYFDPYFEGIHSQVQDMIALMMGNFDQRFEHEQEYLQECLINPLQALVCNLTKRIDSLSVSEELQGVCNDIVVNTQNIS